MCLYPAEIMRVVTPSGGARRQPECPLPTPLRIARPLPHRGPPATPIGVCGFYATVTLLPPTVPSTALSFSPISF